MDRSAVRVTLLGAWVIFGAFVQSSLAASSNCTVGEQERIVVATVLRKISAHSHSTFVVESRTDSSHFARTFTLGDRLLREETSELLPQLKGAPSGSTVLLSIPAPIVPEVQQRELEGDYNAKLSRPCSIPSPNNLSKLVIFRSPAQIKRIFSSNDLVKRWSQFHRLFGDDAELLTLSRVAFDAAKQYALVHVSSGVSQNGGGGELYLLTHLNGQWVIKRVFPTWAT